jgi:anti-anti-sigma factor
MNRDELFMEIAVKAKLLTPAQIEDAKKLRAMLARQQFALSLPEIVAKKEFLNPHQVRFIHIAIRYEELRENDVDLADFILQKGFLPLEKLNEALSAQDAAYREGRHFPRLEDLLVQKKHLTPQQLHVVLRAWEQLDGKAREGSSPRVPRPQPSVPPPQPAAPSPPPKPVQLDRKLEQGLALENLRVVLRKSRVREGASETLVFILDLAGSLDGHSSRRFDLYLNDLIEAGVFRMVIACEKLEYISSAGIGVLAGAVKRCRDESGDLRLASVDERVKKIIGLVGLQSLVRIYDNERGAVMSFKYG